MKITLQYEFDPAASIDRPFWCKLMITNHLDDQKLGAIFNGRSYEEAGQRAYAAAMQLHEMYAAPPPPEEEVTSSGNRIVV